MEDGEVLVKLTGVGVNFDDVYYRSGLYMTSYPFILGMEAVGAGVTKLKRVMYASSHSGNYAEYAGVPASIVIPVPDDIDDRSAATAVLLICASGRLSLIGPTLAVDVKRSFAHDTHDTTSHY
jgi:NADPH:quinone reductase-like Zn-dependent oxidoreductase